MLKQALSLAAAGVLGCAGAPAPEPKTPETEAPLAALPAPDGPYIRYNEIQVAGVGGERHVSMYYPIRSFHDAALFCVRAGTPEAAEEEARRAATAVAERQPSSAPVDISEISRELLADGTAKNCHGILQPCEHAAAVREELLRVAKCPCPNPDACGE